MRAAEHYRSQRARVTELVQGLTPQQLETRVPGCPEWTVRELLSHLTALTADVDAGRLEGAGSPPWTAVQVEARQGLGVDDLLAEWEKYAPGLEAQLDEWGDFGWVVVWDRQEGRRGRSAGRHRASGAAALVPG